ncbi:A disintegrin and metalloproteinase with thrombospondin motifs 16, partial [Saguinus oedipus]
GCDNVLGSDAVEDTCGVCKGNNSACTIHRGLYTKHHHTNQYYHMVTIPSGARSIRIYEMNISTSYISVCNALRRYYLNGHWTVDWPGRYKFSGTTFDYRRSYNEPENLIAAGPTNETLIVEETVLDGRRAAKAQNVRAGGHLNGLAEQPPVLGLYCPTTSAPLRLELRHQAEGGAWGQGASGR